MRVPQKSRGILREGAPVSEKYAFIEAEHATVAADAACAPSITQICSWLQVSRSGFYEWRSRPDSAAAKRRQELKPLITAAIEMAARNLDLPADAIFHSDRGSNYTSGEFAAVLGRLGIRQSVGRTGICFDNALAESFNAALKVERVHRTAYPTRKKAREDIARYIELRYNRMRLHSGLGYRTPQEALDEYLNRQLAA